MFIIGAAFMCKSNVIKQEIVSVNGKPIKLGCGAKVIPNTNIIISHTSGKYIGV